MRKRKRIDDDEPLSAADLHVRAAMTRLRGAMETEREALRHERVALDAERARTAEAHARAKADLVAAADPTVPVELDVCGTLFRVPRAALLRNGTQTYFGAMLQPHWFPSAAPTERAPAPPPVPQAAAASPAYYITRSPVLFPYVVAFLLEGPAALEQVPAHLQSAVYTELDYFALPLERAASRPPGFAGPWDETSFTSRINWGDSASTLVHTGHLFLGHWSKACGLRAPRPVYGFRMRIVHRPQGQVNVGLCDPLFIKRTMDTRTMAGTWLLNCAEGRLLHGGQAAEGAPLLGPVGDNSVVEFAWRQHQFTITVNDDPARRFTHPGLHPGFDMQSSRVIFVEMREPGAEVTFLEYLYDE